MDLVLNYRNQLNSTQIRTFFVKLRSLYILDNKQLYFIQY